MLKTFFQDTDFFKGVLITVLGGLIVIGVTNFIRRKPKLCWTAESNLHFLEGKEAHKQTFYSHLVILYNYGGLTLSNLKIVFDGKPEGIRLTRLLQSWSDTRTIVYDEKSEKLELLKDTTELSVQHLEPKQQIEIAFLSRDLDCRVSSVSHSAGMGSKTVSVSTFYRDADVLKYVLARYFILVPLAVVFLAVLLSVSKTLFVGSLP